jgi:hypothetical protein
VDESQRRAVFRGSVWGGLVGVLGRVVGGVLGGVVDGRQGVTVMTDWGLSWRAASTEVPMWLGQRQITVA